jgi:predicted ester cyclase
MGKNYSLLDELIGRDFVDHTPSPGQPGGVAGVWAKVEGLRCAFPDLRFILEETVAVQYYWTGTHKGAFLDVAPTGRTVVVRGMDFYRVRNGAIVEHWHTVDELGLLRQLGRM